MNTIIVKYKALYLSLFLSVTIILLQIYVLNNLKSRVTKIDGKDLTDLFNYITKDPQLTVAELTMAALLKDLEGHRISSLDSTLLETFLFSFYPLPRSNLTSSFLASKKAFSKQSLLTSRLKQLYNLLNDKRNVCSKTAMIGGWSCETRADGAKPVCVSLNPFNHNKNCLVYSFGVGHDFTFETEMTNYGCQVFAFDDDDTHFYENIVIENLYFFKVRLGAALTVLDLSDTVKKMKYRYLYRPLDNIMYILQHEDLSIDLLKIDIEGDEWEVLNESLCKSGILNRTRQLILETHLNALANFTNVQEEQLTSNISYYNKALQCLIDHKFVLSLSEPNDIRPTFSVVNGLIFKVYEEQLWINTNFETTGNETKGLKPFTSEELEKTSRLMEKRSI